MKSHTNIIDFRKGSPAPELLPVGMLTAAFEAIMGDQVVSAKCLDYGPGAGDDHVRETIAR